jgi:hypothetical protein
MVYDTGASDDLLLDTAKTVLMLDEKIEDELAGVSTQTTGYR